MEADGAPFYITPFLCQLSILRVFKALATRIRGRSKQMSKSLRIANLRPLAGKDGHQSFELRLLLSTTTPVSVANKPKQKKQLKANKFL